MITKIIAAVLATALTGSAWCQKLAITLTFTANYKISSEFLKLDSISIANVSRSVDTMLYYPDTVLDLDYTAGFISENWQNESFRILQNCTNTVTGQTIIWIFVPARDKMLINISDESGRSLLRSSLFPQRGYHSFAFHPGRKGVFSVTATWKGSSRSVKIISEVKNREKMSLTYFGYEGGQEKSGSPGTLSEFIFNPGDSLVFTGYSGRKAGVLKKAVIRDKPVCSQTYRFEFH